jgi:hypothetical protein
MELLKWLKVCQWVSAVETPGSGARPEGRPSFPLSRGCHLKFIIVVVQISPLVEGIRKCSV